MLLQCILLLQNLEGRDNIQKGWESKPWHSCHILHLSLSLHFYLSVKAFSNFIIKKQTSAQLFIVNISCVFSFNPKGFSHKILVRFSLYNCLWIHSYFSIVVKSAIPLFAKKKKHIINATLLGWDSLLQHLLSVLWISATYRIGSEEITWISLYTFREAFLKLAFNSVTYQNLRHSQIINNICLVLLCRSLIHAALFYHVVSS